jgi:aminoglycoside phosphotransferase (APT) family kinase protein
MSLSAHRSIEAISAGLTRWLDATRPGAHTLDRCDRPSEGLSSETLLCRARSDQGPTWAFVVRLPPSGEGAFPAYDLHVQADAQRFAAFHGVPVAAPVELVDDPAWLGTAFLVAPMVDGHVPGSMPLFDPWITEASPDQRGRLHAGLTDQLARLHRVPVEDAPASIPCRNVDGELRYWRDYLDWYADGAHLVPQLHDAFDWCAANRPDGESAPVLLWGDVRLGNVIFDDERRVLAVLDWEMTSVGAAEHDIAWWLTLEAIQDELFGRRVEGFPTADQARVDYETRIGHELRDLHWFEVFAMVRSTAVMTRIGLLHERAGQPGFFPMAENPILPLIARRIEAPA